jgi:hypothetical protein
MDVGQHTATGLANPNPSYPSDPTRVKANQARDNPRMSLFLMQDNRIYPHPILNQIFVR